MHRALVKGMGIALTAAAVATTAAAPPRAQAAENVGMLFDFEDEAGLKDWSAFENERMKAKDAAPRLEWSAENATAGARSLKLTFTKGRFAGITTDQIPLTEWKPPLTTFHADVTATRDCVVLFRGVPQKTKEATDPKNEGPVFVKVARLSAGRNHVHDIIGYGSYATPGANSGPIVQFDIILYDAQDGDVLFVDAIRLSSEPSTNTTSYRQRTVFNLGEQPKDYPPYPMPEKLTVLGFGQQQEFASVIELAESLKDTWVEPRETTVDQVESDFRAAYEQVRRDHPNAVLAILRDGEKGFDPTNPDKPFAGWSDAYLGAQAPMGLSYRQLGGDTGTGTTIEFAFRHRCPFYRVDLSSIPAGATIHRAQLVLVRWAAPDRKQLEGNYKFNSPFKPTFWVAEACNRPWVEAEVNGFEYARGKFWNEANGMNWTGDDPDFLPTIVAYGQSGLTVSTWDFTEAVRSWTTGTIPNHGFCLYPVRGYLDFGRFWAREQKDPKRRPAMLVIYEPK